MLWDLFCRVIDNHGDLGVCWRLARRLAARGHRVRLWVDDARALAWMAPTGCAGVQLLDWHAPPQPPGEVVVEAFGCDPPADFVAGMAAAAAAGAAPVWINLEYLSAEAYVARSHGLRSPQFSGPGAGLHKWFFYPGFDDAGGGLLHGDAACLPAPQAALAQSSASASAAVTTAPPAAPGHGALLFGYQVQDPDGLLRWLSGTLPGQPLRLAPGTLAQQWPTPQAERLDYCAQPDFDARLAASALNLVRGEDSFARAQLVSDAPMLWQIYPQSDAAHLPKLQAFLTLYLQGLADATAQAVRQAFAAHNGLGRWPAPLTPSQLHQWRGAHAAWRRRLLAQSCLSQRLAAFVHSRRVNNAT